MTAARLAFTLALVAGCGVPVQLPTDHVRCGAVQVTAELNATAAHCAALGEVVYRDEVADLMLLRRSAGWAAELELEPVAAGSEATMTAWGLDFVVAAPLVVQHDRYLLLAWRQTLDPSDPQLERGMSGSGLWQGGKLLGIATRADSAHAVFVHAREIARAIERVGGDAAGLADEGRGW